MMVPDRKDYPILNGVFDYFIEHTPRNHVAEYDQKQYNPELYNGEPNQTAQKPEQRDKDIHRLIAHFKTSLFRRMVSHDLNLIQKLKKERQNNAFGIKIDGKNDQAFIEWYNLQLIEIVGEACERIRETFCTIFVIPTDDPELFGWNIKSSFEMYYEEFGAKNASPLIYDPNLVQNKKKRSPKPPIPFIKYLNPKGLAITLDLLKERVYDKTLNQVTLNKTTTLLIALYHLEIIDHSVLFGQDTNLHRSLVFSFGLTETRQAMNLSIKAFFKSARQIHMDAIEENEAWIKKIIARNCK